MKNRLKESFIKVVKSVKGWAVSFRVDQVRLPNGKKATRAYLDHPGAVAAIPLVKPGHILMVKQYRYPVGEVTYEIPAGKLDKGENALQTVKRELQEETGYQAKTYKKIVSFWPTSAFANEVIHIYIAKGLKKGKANPDDDEFVETEIMPLKKILKMIRSGKIKDSKTIIGILNYVQFYE